MKKNMSLSLAFLLLLICSCGTANTRGDDYEAVYQRSSREMPSSSSSRPAWVDGAWKIDEGDYIALIGSSSNASTKEKALDSAKNNALKQLSEYFGVSVSATFTEKRTKINGKRDYKITNDVNSSSRQIEVKESELEDLFIERRGNGWTAYAKVAVPKSELARIQIELDAAGVWAIQSDVPQCESKIRDLFPVFGRHGVNMTQQIEYSYKTPDQIYRENAKMFYLKVECKEQKSEEYNGEFYSIIQVTAELFNLMTGTTINRWQQEGKGAAYSRNDALTDGVSKAVEEIIGQIE